VRGLPIPIDFPQHFPALLAEFERDLIGERTKAGLQAARARGRRGGRKRALTPNQITLAKSMKADSQNSIADICATLKISKRTLYRYTSEQGQPPADACDVARLQNAVRNLSDA
jgi:DNA invertase Pin-like site-specific DNA recombinase